MKTACGLTYSGPGRIAICRSARGFQAGFRKYKLLAPGDWFKNWLKGARDYAEYYERFQRQLDRLDPKRVLKELKALAVPHEPVLLCWERPPLRRDNWCHRAIVARWFFDNLRLVVEERYHGEHKSRNWRKSPPFTTRYTPWASKPSRRAPAR